MFIRGKGKLLNSMAMANEQPDQQSNTVFKPGLWIQLCLVILGLLAVGAASACSCSQVGVENLVLDKRLSLAKIVVVPPTFTERVASLLNFFKADSPESRTYSVKVLEVITGSYDATALKVQSPVSSDCGVDLSPGETYYHRASPTAAGGTSMFRSVIWSTRNMFGKLMRTSDDPSRSFHLYRLVRGPRFSGVPSRLCMLITAASQAIRTAITSGYSEIWPTMVALSRKRRSYRSPARNVNTTSCPAMSSAGWMPVPTQYLRST